MWPWGHLAVGFLAYAGVLDSRFRTPPGDLAAIVLVLGTQFPDLVDKPLAWYVGVLPNGRSLGHSLPIAVALFALLYVLARRYDRADLAAAFGVGHVSHLAGDAMYPLLAGRFAELAFLGWPLLPPVQYGGPASISVRFVELGTDLAAGDVAVSVAFELLLAVVAVTVWVRHGFPGIPVGGRD